jgi:putative ABC transport system permease protein
VKALGWGSPEDALGKRIAWQDHKDGVVIGVVRDFHVKSLHQSIDPMVMHIWPRWSNYVAVRLQPGHTAEALDFIRSRWDARSPGEPFEPFFLDARFDAMYTAEERFGRLFGGFALLAVFIAALGLFGLASFTVEQRTKEIGIRKVMGASVPRIVLLLSADYARLMLAACVLAVPLVYLAMDRWLSGFAYRVDLGPGVFVLASLAVLVVAWLAVGYQSVRAALADPVQALRYE